MKAATGAAFSVDQKYGRVESLVMVYVWNACIAEAVEFYAMTWKAAVKVAEDMGWTNTASWQTGGRYAVTSPSQCLKQEIDKAQDEARSTRSTTTSAGTPLAIDEPAAACASPTMT